MRHQIYKRTLASLASAVLLLGSSGCYHSIVDTGAEPGPVGYHEKWETAWLGGLIAAEVDAEGICDGPWVRVETQKSFLNGLVSALTLGIYSPHEVEVVCAPKTSQSSDAAAGDEETSQRRSEEERGA